MVVTSKAHIVLFSRSETDQHVALSGAAKVKLTGCPEHTRAWVIKPFGGISGRDVNLFLMNLTINAITFHIIAVCANPRCVPTSVSFSERVKNDDVSSV